MQKRKCDKNKAKNKTKGNLNRLDYIELYANKLKTDNTGFKQQKMIIESQMKSSSALFKKKFGTGKVFKANAKNYLKKIHLI